MKSRVGIALLWILVFVLGGVAGAVSHYLYREHTKPARNAIVSVKPDDIINRMARDLKLDDEQVESLKSIFAQSRKKYRALHQQYQPQWEAIRNEADEQIKQMLNPSQRVEYEEFLKKVYSQPHNSRSQNSK